MTALVAAGIVIVVAGAAILAKGIAQNRSAGARRRREARGLAADASGVGRSDLLPRGRSPAVRRPLDAGRRQGRRLRRGRERARWKRWSTRSACRSAIRSGSIRCARSTRRSAPRRSAIWRRPSSRATPPSWSARAAPRATGASAWPSRCKKTAGGLAPTERNDLYWEKLQTRDGIKYKVSIRYAVPKANFEKLVEAYAVAGDGDGRQGGVLLPAARLALRRHRGRGGHPRGQRLEPALRRHPGGRPGARRHGPRGPRRALVEARARRGIGGAGHAQGGTLVLKVKRGDAPAIDTRLRIARGGQASADSSNRAAPDPRTARPRVGRRRAATGKNQTGNIWDDNPEE